MKLLVANRAEIAVRLLRAAQDLGLATVAVASEDDRQSPHLRHADAVEVLPGTGPAAYLDVEAVVAAATTTGCWALHPGYGFLSESAELARRCEAAGVVFVGPRPETLDALGDKVSARALAEKLGIPVLAGSAGAATLEEADAFLRSLPGGASIAVKAVAGGGGRGMRRVESVDELPEAWSRCASEALAAFGSDALYLFFPTRRDNHIGSLVCQSPSDRVPDAAGRAGNHRRFSFQGSHLLVLLHHPKSAGAVRAWCVTCRDSMRSVPSRVR